MLSKIIERFDFREYKSRGKLSYAQNFKTYEHVFPHKHFHETVIYWTVQFMNSCEISGILLFFVFTTDNNLKKKD